MVRRRRQDEGKEAKELWESDGFAADLNEVVAYNFKRARDMYGWTQDEVAARLERFLGVRLPQASISGIERGYRGRHREFDAQEILAFACCFDVPLIWFFIPPPDDTRRLRNTSDSVNELYSLLLGREDQLELLDERFRELGMRGPSEDDRVWERLLGTRSPATIGDYRTRRKDLLLALLDQYSDPFDKAAEELGVVVDKLRQAGLAGYVAAKMNDRDYVLPPESRGKFLSMEEEEQRLRNEAAKEKDQPQPPGPDS